MVTEIGGGVRVIPGFETPGLKTPGFEPPGRGTSGWSARLARIAAIGVLVGALGLAGCGRKAGLDPPPGASLVEHKAGAADPVREERRTAEVRSQPKEGIDRNGKPVAPRQGEHKPFFLDWLVD
jgi:hypothetical protein